MKTKKLILGLGLGVALLGNYAARAQGLDSIIVEKYYRSDAADALGSVGVLPAGSVTYRIYVDMAPGYVLQSVYGDAAHNLLINTTGAGFFNSEDRGATTPNAIGTAFMNDNANALDSWITIGGAASGQMGVLKSEDVDGTSLITGSPILNNAPASIGIPIKTQDGMFTAANGVIVLAGITTELDILDNVSQAGSSIMFNNQAYAVAGGVSGPTATNRVLIGQFTTNGVFHFELNVQIALGATVENYVSSAPTGAEQTHASLTATLGNPPTVTIATVPATGNNFFLGNAVTMSTVVGDADGSVVSVEFFDGATSLGTDASAPFTFTTTPAGAGAHSFTAVATDNDGNTTTSAASTLTGVVNNPPTAVITAPAAGPIVGLPVLSTQTITITATATDTDGTIDSVEFYANNIKVGVDVSGPSPYSFDWTPTAYGFNTLRARSYDNNGGVTNSANVVVNISNPNAKPYLVKTVDTSCALTGFCLPINAKDTVSNVIGFDMVLNYDKAMVTPTGSIAAGSDLIANPNWVTIGSNIDAVNGTINISVSLNNAAPINTFFNGVGEMICVGFNKTANFTSIDTASFSVDSIIESRYTGVTTILVDPGKYITHRDSTLNASLQFWADGSAIDNNVATNVSTNNATCTNKSFAANPNAAGVFSIALTNAQVSAGVSLNIDRDVAPTTSVQPVVNGFDALLTRKVVVSDLSFIPSVHQMIAMDVNMDGTISAGDVSQINQRSVLAIGEFKQAWNYTAAGVKVPGTGDSKDWIFIDGTTLTTNGAYLISSIYPSADGVGFNKDNSPVMDSCIATAITNAASCPVIGAEVYTGIMLGDVNGNFKSIGATAGIKSLSDDKIVFDLSNAISSNGFVTIPVSIVSANTINSLDFSMQFDGAVYNSIVNHASYLDAAMDNLNADDATLRFTSYSLTNFDITHPIVSVVVEASQVNAADLKALAGYLNGEEATVEVKGNGVTATASTEAVSVYPNPATETVNVVVSENANVQLIDMNGTVVVSLNVNANQKQVISTENLANGVYSLRVSNENFVTIEKVVIAK